jgi:hypothetical protein
LFHTTKTKRCYPTPGQKAEDHPTILRTRGTISLPRACPCSFFISSWACRACLWIQRCLPFSLIKSWCWRSFFSWLSTLLTPSPVFLNVSPPPPPNLLFLSLPLPPVFSCRPCLVFSCLSCFFPCLLRCPVVCCTHRHVVDVSASSVRVWFFPFVCLRRASGLFLCHSFYFIHPSTLDFPLTFEVSSLRPLFDTLATTAFRYSRSTLVLFYTTSRSFAFSLSFSRSHILTFSHSPRFSTAPVIRSFLFLPSR